MKLVLLTAGSSEGEVQHRYVAAVLAEAFPKELKAIVVADPPRKSLVKAILGYWRRYSVDQVCSRIRAKLRDRSTKREQRRQATYREILFPDGESGLMPRRDLLRLVPSHNGADCLSVLDDIRPDIIVVYGTMVIRRPVFAKASMGILNMHTGISPRYRGSDTIFWALHNEEPEWVGVTVHRLDQGLDSGAILSIAKPDITDADDENSLFAKCVKIGCEHLVDAIRLITDGTAEETAQKLAEGHEYRSVDRTVAADKKVARLLSEGLLVRYAAEKD